MAINEACKCGCGQIVPEGKRTDSKFFDKHHRAAYHKNIREAGKRAMGITLSEIMPTKTTPVAILENAGKVKKRSHAGMLESCPRLQKTLARLEQGPATTKEISDFTGSEAVHSDVHELRQNLRERGKDIICKYFRRSTEGRKIYTYELIRTATE